MTYPEKDAIAVLRAGDIGGLETLVRLYQLRALRTAYTITGDQQAAEDVVADAFLAVHDHIDQFDERQPFAPWFYRIVVNGALKAVRGAQRAQRMFTADRDEDNTSAPRHEYDPSPGPEEQVFAEEQRRFLLKLIYSLPPEQRAALVLKYYLDMDEATIAQTLKCPKGTVKWRLYAARERIRRSLAPMGFPILDY